VTLAVDIDYAARTRDATLAAEYRAAGLPTFERRGFGSGPRNIDRIAEHLDSLETLLRETRAQYEAGSFEGVARGIRIMRHHLGLVLRCVLRRGAI